MPRLLGRPGQRRRGPGVDRGRLAPALVGVALLLPAAWCIACASSNGERSYLVPGNSVRGLAVFGAKSCDACHSLPGEPPGSAPPLGVAGDRPLTEAGLLASFWNHAPRMRSEIEQRPVDPPEISESEMADLFALLYYLSVLDPEGDPERGRWVFLEKGCDNCHAVSLNEPERAGPGVPYWSAHTTPTRLARAMWNHAAAMRSRMAREGLPWAELGRSDMADLVAWVRQINQIAVPRAFRLGDQRRGRAQFSARGCSRCHAVRSSEASDGPSLEEMNGAAGRVGEMSALMWNHFPAMSSKLEEWRSARLHLSTVGMADLLAYLFSVGYFDDKGDARAGEEVFVASRCSSCHELRGLEAGRRYRFPATTSPIALATALWNHGSTMIRTIEGEGLEWPRLARGQMVDLLAYLGTSD